MPLNISRQTLETERVVDSRIVKALIETDAMAQGADEVLLCDAMCVIDSAQAQQGRILLDGKVRFQVLYRAQGEVTSLMISAPLREMIEAEVGPKMAVGCFAEIESAEARLMAGRILCRAVPAIRVTVTALEPCAVISGLEGLEGVCVQRARIASLKVNAEAQAAASLSEEFELPRNLGAERTLMTRARVDVSDMFDAVGGVMVKGSVALEAVHKCALPGRPIAVTRHALPFEQLVELPEWLRGDLRAEAWVTGVTAQTLSDEEGALLRAGVELLIGVKALGVDESEAVTDAYAVGASDIQMTCGQLRVRTESRQVRALQTAKLKFTLPELRGGDGRVSGVSQALYCVGRPTVMQAESADGKVTVDGVMELQVVYLPVGGDDVLSAMLQSPFTVGFQADLPADTPLLLEAFDCECMPVTSSQLELKCTLALNAEVDAQAEYQVALDAQEVEGKDVPQGITVLLAQQGDTAWDLAKRFRVPMGELESMNPGLGAGVNARGRGAQVMIFRR